MKILFARVYVKNPLRVSALTKPKSPQLLRVKDLTVVGISEESEIANASEDVEKNDIDNVDGDKNEVEENTNAELLEYESSDSYYDVSRNSQYFETKNNKFVKFSTGKFE